MGQLKQDLLADASELIETHTAWVFLNADEVIKLKKPVDFGFLDFTTKDKRRAACEAEVELNSRLAPGVYRAVVRITRDAHGRHRVEGEGQVVDYAVRMKRLSDACRADLLLEAGELTEQQVDLLARTLAAFHERMPTSAAVARYGTPGVLLEHLAENFEQTRTSILRHISQAEAAEIAQRQLSFVRENRDLFIARAVSGRVRDGHGDLRLEHVYFTEPGRPTIIDCIEFNERFRFADVCADVAFLSMDLARLGRVDLAERLLAAYAREANDFDLYPLVDFYEGYRAFVRAKVATMLEADAGAPFPVRQRAGHLARRHYLLCVSTGRAALVAPALVVVGGVIASGKSTLSERVSRQLSAPVVSSDRTRKYLLGLAPESRVDERPFEGAYAPGFSERVYSELLRRAASVLRSGRSVVLDASFRTRELRARAKLLAASYQVPFYFVECRAEATELERRLLGRDANAHESDARAGLLRDFSASWQAVDELSNTEHIVIDTGQSPKATAEELARRLPGWPRGLTQ